jgi:hypothetical protein
MIGDGVFMHWMKAGFTLSTYEKLSFSCLVLCCNAPGDDNKTGLRVCARTLKQQSFFPAWIEG